MNIRDQLTNKNMVCFTAKDRTGCFLQKGQRILYEGEEAQVIKVKPVLVIKTRDRVICGALSPVDRH